MTRCNMVKMVKMVIFMIWVHDGHVDFMGERPVCLFDNVWRIGYKTRNNYIGRAV